MKEQKNKKRRANSSRSVFADPKQYISFFAALILIQTIFWLLFITVGTNAKTTDTMLGETYKHHFVLTGVSGQAYTDVQNMERIESLSEIKNWPTLEYLGGSAASGYKIGVILNEKNLTKSNDYFWSKIKDYKIGISKGNAEYTPLYTEGSAAKTQNQGKYIMWSLIFFAATALVMLLLAKISKPKTLDSYGERVYLSTSRENMRAALKKILFILVSVFASLAIVFLMLIFVKGNGAAYFLMYMAMFLISVLFLTELFSVRVNHYKFRYGIYMTFGAGFKKLYTSSIFEVLTVSMISLLPSFAIATLICLIIYLPLGVSLTIPFSAVIGTVLFNIIIVIIATYLPMKTMSLKSPSALLSADDNSNLASSPRRSANIFKKSFPLTYELRGMWRFRKYFIRLIVTAVSFSVVFLCGLYIAHVNEKNASLDIPEFEASAQDYFSVSDEDFEYIIEALEENSAFDYMFWKDSSYASGLRSHILIKDENVVRKKYAYDIQGKEKRRLELISSGFKNTVDNFEFSAYNKTLLDAISENGIYNIEGDIYSVLNDPNTVIISEYIANLAHFDFEVGDTIILATPGEFSSKFNNTLVKSGKRSKALEDLIMRSEFVYKEYKIGAIIDYGGVDGNFIIGMSQTEYSRILKTIDTKTTPSFMRNLLVYTKDDASQESIDQLNQALREELSPYSYTVNRSNSAILKEVDEKTGQTEVILGVSLLVMLISPLIWFFSQLRFYTRRSKEMYILSSLGATGKRLMGIYLVSGIFLSLISAVITVGLSYAADYLIYLICTLLVPTMSPAGGVIVKFYMPPAALVICIVSSVLCGFLSSYLPFILKRFIRSKSDRYTSDGR